jgi:hypothetical protein
MRSVRACALVCLPGARNVLGSAAVAAILCLFASTDAARAQALCDPALPRNDAQSSGYRPRGDRCEGIYKRPVASFGVELVSLTAQSELADLCGPGGAVFMIWPAPMAGLSGAGPIHVQAESLRRQLYYRLDVDRQSSASSFQWPQDPRCSNEVSLGAPDLGILARASAMLGAKPIRVLLPVGLSRQPTAPVRPPYQAVLMPGRRLREVYVSVWRYGSGPTPTPVVSERPLSMKPYPAGTRVTIPLTAAEVQQPGVYRVRASVEFDSGETEAVEFYFLHAR